MTGSADPAVEVDGLRKAYDGREVLRDVTFSVARGELLALLGPNGAGKTTTLEIIEGYRRADGGRVRVLGLDPGRDGASLRPRIGLMLQDGGLDPRTTPREILRLFARLFAAPADPDALLATVGLEAVRDTRCRRLSGGERQRLGLALALVGRPELLVLDEPTAGMDPEATAATRDLIRSLRSGGTTILLTTHDLADVEHLADRVAILAGGRIVALDTPSALGSAAPPALRFRLAAPLDPRAREALAARLGSAVLDEPDGRLRIDGRLPDPSAIAALAAACAELGLLLAEVRTDGSSLEERYLELVGRVGGPEPERRLGS